MTLLFALSVGVLFGSGAYLILKADLLRITVGIVLISNAANLTLMSSALTRGQAPTYPLAAGEEVSDPLVQAMTLTALVIGFAVTALLVSVAFRVRTSSGSVDIDELSRREQETERELEREDVSV